MTCPGLLSCKPHVKEFRGDTSSQLLLLMKHHQAILSNYRNARSPFWPRMWYPFWGQQRVQAIPGQGCSSSVAGGPGWVRTQYTPPPPQQWGLGRAAHTSRPGLVGPQCRASTPGPAAPRPAPCSMGSESHRVIVLQFIFPKFFLASRQNAPLSELAAHSLLSKMHFTEACRPTPLFLPCTW